MGYGQAAAELRGGLMHPLIPWVLAHFVLAAVVTWLARGYALKHRLLDQPGERRSHAVATPRGGGIAIVVAVVMGCVWLGIIWPGQRLFLSAYVAGLVLVAGIGWLDDHRPLTPWSRLAVQAVAGLILALGTYVSTQAWLPGIAAFVLVMVLVNVWNFMDGINGLATSQAILVATGISAVLAPGPLVWLAVGLSAAACGFLPFNFPKARIFLGDVGSGALGYLLAGLLVASFDGTEVPWPLLFLPLAAFLVDAGFTLLGRMLRKEPWWTPHVSHLYQQLARVRASHLQVTLAYALFTLMGVLIMATRVNLSLTGAVILTTGWYVMAICIWFSANREFSMDKDA